MKEYAEVRVWQVEFGVSRYFPSIPMPDIVVEEIQRTPSYIQDGKKREDEGAQLVITLKGTGGIKIQDANYSLTPGKVFLHNHNDSNICYYYPQGHTEDWNFLWIAFYGKAAEDVVRDINKQYGYLFDTDLNGELVQKLMSYRKCDDNMIILSPLEGASLVYEVLSMLVANTEQKLKQSQKNIIASTVQQLLLTDPPSRWHVEKISERFHISREHLSRLYKEQTGEPLSQSMLRQKFEMAIDLLLHTNLSVKEIADKCGWNNYTVFSRIFKKHLKMSPLMIRKNGIKPKINL